VTLDPAQTQEGRSYARYSTLKFNSSQFAPEYQPQLKLYGKETEPYMNNNRSLTELLREMENEIKTAKREERLELRAGDQIVGRAPEARQHTKGADQFWVFYFELPDRIVTLTGSHLYEQFEQLQVRIGDVVGLRYDGKGGSNRTKKLFTLRVKHIDPSAPLALPSVKATPEIEAEPEAKDNIPF
jgi:hypothetical protein